MEAIRTFIRARFGSGSPLYVLGARVLDLWYAIVHEGAAGLSVLAMRRKSGDGVWLNLRSLDHPIRIRPGTEDVGSLINNVLREEYGQFAPEFSPKTVVDAGAYIGDTAAYFLSRFKRAQVIALEPDLSNFELAEQNLASYGERVTLLRRALWDSVGTVEMTGRQTGCAVSGNAGDIPATTIPVLMRTFGIEQIDLLKMDIEGAEVTVLRSGHGAWLERVAVLLLETHGEKVEEIVLPILAKEGFSIRRHRNVWYCTRYRASE